MVCTLSLDDNKSKAEEISKSSLLMNLFSKIDSKSYALENIPFIMGGENLFVDNKAKDVVEQAFGQLNIPDLFKQFDFILNASLSTVIKLKEDLHLTPNFYVLKAKFGDLFNLMTLITPYSDINLTELYKDLKDITLDFNGLLRRTSKELELGKISDMSQLRQERENVGKMLLERIYYKVFLQRELSGSVERPRKPPNLVAVLFQECDVESFYKCTSCSYKFPMKNKSKDLSEISCPECSSTNIEISPPYLNPQNVSIAFPNDLVGFEKDENSPYSPMDLYYLYQASSLPLDIKYLTYEIDPEVFKQIITIPHISWFDYRENDDNIQLYSLWQKNEDKIVVITGISDSSITGPDILPSMSLRIFIRDLNDAVKKKYSREKMIRKSILSDWNLSSWIKLGDETVPDSLASWQGLMKEVIHKEEK